MRKDFDKWNKLKKLIDDKSINFNINDGDIWWMSFGLNVGIEIDGKNEQFERSGLVLKKFNKEMAWILPITSQIKNDKFHYKFVFHNKEYCVALTQIRTVSIKRFARKVGVMPVNDFKNIVKKVLGFFPYSNENPH